MSGPAPVTFQNASDAATMVALPVAGTYTLRLLALNAAGATVASDDVTVTVNPNAVVIGSTSTPLDHLKSINRVAFKNGHTLMPLTISSCAVSDDIEVELVKHWGYAAQFDESSNFTNGPLIREVKANPGRYPEAMSQASLYPIFENFDGRRTNVPRLPATAYIRDAAGNIILVNNRPITSPEAPDAVFKDIGNYLGTTARKIEDTTGEPIKIVINAGEYGLWLAGESGASQWGQDPRVAAAYLASGYTNWFGYISHHKARQERLIKEGMFARLARGRPAYSWYQEAFGPENGRWFGWQSYTFIWERFLDANRKPTVSDYSSPQMYYKFANAGWSGLYQAQGIPWDALTQALRDAGGAVSLGQRNLYPWVSQGWDAGDSRGISDDELFLGMMKTYYTAGAIGAVSGYFTCEGAPFQAMRQNTAVGTGMPTQIRNLYLLGQALLCFRISSRFCAMATCCPEQRRIPMSVAGQPQQWNSKQSGKHAWKLRMLVQGRFARHVSLPAKCAMRTGG